MFRKDISFKKAAVLFAAFFILSARSFGAKIETEKLESVKKKSGQLLMQQQKTEAIRLIQNYLKTETNRAVQAEAAELLVKVSQTFISKEAQEAYEISLNQFPENVKESKKSVQACLQLEPQNMECLIQKIKIASFEKDKAAIDSTYETVFEFARNTRIVSWLDVYLHKDNSVAGFKDRSFVKKFNEKPTEMFFLLTVLEIDRAFLAKNFARAKDGIEYLEKNFPDYPDHIYFRQRLNAESLEEKSAALTENNSLYSAKCKSLAKSVARKFRYDFDLCQRGQQ